MRVILDDGDVLSLSIIQAGKTKVRQYDLFELEGSVKLVADGSRTRIQDSLYSYEKPVRETCKITAAPTIHGGEQRPEPDAGMAARGVLHGKLTRLFAGLLHERIITVKIGVELCRVI